MRFTYTYRSLDGLRHGLRPRRRPVGLNLFRLDVAENVVLEFPRASEEPRFVGREAGSADDLGLKQAKRAYKVGNLKKSVSAWLYGLREFNGTRQSSGGDMPEKVGDSLLSAVVIDLNVFTCGKCLLVSSGKVGKLAFKGGRHLGECAGIALVDGETVVGEVNLPSKSHHAMEYPAAKIVGHETESVVAAQNGAGMETQVFDPDFLKPSRKLCGGRFNRNALVVQDKSKYVKTRCRGRFAKDARFVYEQTQCIVSFHRPINKSDGNHSTSLKAEGFPRITTTPILRPTSLEIVSHHCVWRKGDLAENEIHLRDDGKCIGGLCVGIAEKRGGKIDIRPLLLDLYHMDNVGYCLHRLTMKKKRSQTLRPKTPLRVGRTVRLDMNLLRGSAISVSGCRMWCKGVGGRK